MLGYVRVREGLTLNTKSYRGLYVGVAEEHRHFLRMHIRLKDRLHVYIFIIYLIHSYLIQHTITYIAQHNALDMWINP